MANRRVVVRALIFDTPPRRAMLNILSVPPIISNVSVEELRGQICLYAGSASVGLRATVRFLAKVRGPL